MADSVPSTNLLEKDDSAGIARRRLLGAVAAAPVIAATISTVAAADRDDAKLLAAWSDYQQAHRDFDAACERLPDGGTNIDHAPFQRRLDAIQARIEATPALGMAGVAVKLRMLFSDQVATDAAFQTAILNKQMSAQLFDEMDAGDRVFWRLIQNVEALADGRVA
jgi:hypothetical protein